MKISDQCTQLQLNLVREIIPGTNGILKRTTTGNICLERY